MVIPIVGEAPPGGMIPSDPTATDVVVEPISDFRWLVRDGRLPPSNVRSLLGYIEEKDGQFEVMQLDHGFAWSFFDSFREATAHFTQKRSGAVSTEGHVLSWKTTADAQ